MVLLQLVSIIYIDDTIICEPRATIPSAISTYTIFCHIIGMILQDQKDGSLEICDAITILGMSYSYDKSSRLLQVSVEAGKILKLKDIGGNIMVDIVNKKIDFDSLGAWLGLAIHIAFSRRFRCGMELFRYLYLWVQDKNFPTLVKSPTEM